jgi:hypothetical protein
MVRLSMSKWKDKSHCIEMLIKAKDFLNTSMPCYYKARYNQQRKTPDQNNP